MHAERATDPTLLAYLQTLSPLERVRLNDAALRARRSLQAARREASEPQVKADEGARSDPA